MMEKNDDILGKAELEEIINEYLDSHWSKKLIVNVLVQNRGLDEQYVSGIVASEIKKRSRNRYNNY